MAFETETRQIFYPMPATTYQGGAVTLDTLPRVGFLARIHYHFSGTLTVTLNGGTVQASPKAPWNIISQYILQSNTVSAIVRSSGFGLKHINNRLHQMSTPDYPHGPAMPSVANEVYQFGVAAGANPVEFGFVVPIALNDRDMTGIQLLQLEMATFQQNIQWNNPIGGTIDFPVQMLTGAPTATLTGTLTPTLEVFALPANQADWPDTSVVHQWLETQQAIGSTGVQTINLLRANIYLAVIHQVVINGALTGPGTSAIDEIDFRYNNSETPYQFTRKALQQVQRYRYGFDLDPGCFIHELFYQGIPGYGGLRDVIAGGAVAELQSLVTVNSGAALGSGNNWIYTLTEQLINTAKPQSS